MASRRGEHPAPRPPFMEGGAAPAPALVPARAPALALAPARAPAQAPALAPALAPAPARAPAPAPALADHSATKAEALDAIEVDEALRNLVALVSMGNAVESQVALIDEMECFQRECWEVEAVREANRRKTVAAKRRAGAERLRQQKSDAEERMRMRKREENRAAAQQDKVTELLCKAREEELAASSQPKAGRRAGKRAAASAPVRASAAPPPVGPGDRSLTPPTCDSWMAGASGSSELPFDDAGGWGFMSSEVAMDQHSRQGCADPPPIREPLSPAPVTVSSSASVLDVGGPQLTMCGSSLGGRETSESPPPAPVATKTPPSRRASGLGQKARQRQGDQRAGKPASAGSRRAGAGAVAATPAARRVAASAAALGSSAGALSAGRARIKATRTSTSGGGGAGTGTAVSGRRRATSSGGTVQMAPPSKIVTRKNPSSEKAKPKAAGKAKTRKKASPAISSMHLAGSAGGGGGGGGAGVPTYQLIYSSEIKELAVAEKISDATSTGMSVKKAVQARQCSVSSADSARGAKAQKAHAQTERIAELHALQYASIRFERKMEKKKDARVLASTKKEANSANLNYAMKKLAENSSDIFTRTKAQRAEVAAGGGVPVSVAAGGPEPGPKPFS